MLHENAVSSDLLSLLRSYQPELEEWGFALAGGTSLALRFGHRISTDLDWFTTRDFEPTDLADRLGATSRNIIGIAAGTLRLVVDSAKLEFLRHAYPRLADQERIQEINMWSINDVAAMKLNAIANRGSKKDFFDLVALLEVRSLPELLEAYRAKYQPASMLMVIRSLAWFDDADGEPDPMALNDLTWQSVKALVCHAVRQLE